jgi:hypothetical protein
MHVNEELRGRIPDSNTGNWSLLKITKRGKIANPDPTLPPGGKRLKIQAELIDDLTEEVYEISINFDPMSGQFGIT